MQPLGPGGAGSLATARSGSASQAHDAGYARLALFPLGIAMLVLFVHLLDRQIFAIVAEPIKAELALSDTQFGLLAGIGFAVLYSVLGIPAALWADRRDRVILLGVATITWSLMTAMNGLATGFWTLLAARAAVAVGEAGGIAPLHSLIADLHEEGSRARAFSILQLGGPIGMFVAFCGGGLIAASFEWRTVFLVAGAIGVVVGGIVLWRMPEPRRQQGFIAPRQRALAGLSGLLAQRGFLWLLAGTALAGAGFYATLSWAPSLLARSFGLDIARIGLVLGVSFGLLGSIAIITAGILGDRLRATRSGAYPLLAAWTIGAAAVAAMVALVLPPSPWSLLLFAVPVMGLSAWQVPMIAAIQDYARADNRASASALFMLALNLGGMGLGPTLVGVLSDALAVDFGQQSLRFALLVVPAALVGASACWLVAARFRPAAAP